VTVVKTGMSIPSSSVLASRRPMGWNGCLISRTARPSHMSVARTRCRSVCAKDHSPPAGTSTVPAGATGKTAVESGLDERSHVDAVHAQGAFAIQEPRCVDVSSLHIDATHHDTG
jgi:hypothetical protein